MKDVLNLEFWKLLSQGNLSSVNAPGDITPVGSAHFPECSIVGSHFKNLALGNNSLLGLNITGCTIDTLNLVNTSIQKPIIIKDSKIKQLILGNGTSSSILVVDEKTEITTFNCEGAGVGEIRIKDALIKIFTLRNSSRNTQVDIVNSHDFESIEISGSLGRLSLSKITSQRIILKIHLAPLLKEVKCSIDFMFTECSQIDANFENCHLSKLSLVNQNLSHITVNGGEYNDLSLQNSNIGALNIDSKIGKTKFDKLTIDDKIHAIDIYNTTFKELCFVKINRNGNIQLTNVDVTKILKIQDCRIDFAKFNNLNLYDCSFTLQDSSISNSQFINIRWPRKYLINEAISKEGIEKVEILWSIREAYRQLKIVCDVQQNRIESLAFKKHELKIYWQIVNIETWNGGCQKWWQHIGDWLVLFTNWIFSDFGLSIGRPLFWLLIVDFALFNRLLYLYDLGIKFDWENRTSEAFWIGFGLFANFLNPVHGFEINGNSVLGFTDFTMRVLSSYFIYYFIKASRKFNL